jgi:glycosyltransferase involved in cell wall biosynthesis
MAAQNLTVIISTYNAPSWLEKVLWGYSVQTNQNFEIIIADDGSTEETKTLIESFMKDYPVKIYHLWHKDEGYRRQELLNKAILKSNYDYILMTDGDCIPRKNFVQIHAEHAKPGRFLSGGYCKLDMSLSNLITKDDIIQERCFNLEWLKSKGKIGFSQKLKLGSKRKFENFLDLTTPTKATFNNCNSSAWKKDYIAINGYDERMRYGGPDRELGERLENYGIKGLQIRHKAVCLHLDHPRGYKTKESLDKNMEIRKFTKDKKVIKTPYGIEKE